MLRDSALSFDCLLQEITKMNNTLTSAATDVPTTKETTTELKTTEMAMQETLLEAETCIVHLEAASERLHADRNEKSNLIGVM